MFSRALLSTAAEQSDDRCKNGKVMQRVVRTTIAASVTLGLASPAGAAPRPDPAPYPDPAPPHHSHRHHHHRRHTATHNAYKTDLSGYEFELIVEGTHGVTGDEELGNRAAVEAVVHPGPPVTPLEEETAMDPEP